MHNSIINSRPAADPGSVRDEASQAGAGERAHSVGAGCFLPTVCRAIEEDVVNVTLINLKAGGLVYGDVAVVTIFAVLIGDTASHIVPTPEIKKSFWLWNAILNVSEQNTEHA